VCDRSAKLEGVPENTILLIQERELVLDLVEAPIMALLDLVGIMSNTWRRFAGTEARLFYEPTVASPFYAYVEREVARSYVTLLERSEVGGLKFRYRAVTVSGRAAPEDPIWQIQRSGAREVAKSTFEPIRETRQ
jgi:hypothetical protein